MPAPISVLARLAGALAPVARRTRVLAIVLVLVGLAVTKVAISPPEFATPTMTVFTPPVSGFVGLYNGQPGGGDYRIGLMASSDGLSWTRYPGNPVISPGPKGTWDDAFVVHPSLARVGTTFVAYYAGYDGVRFRIGRATSQDLVSWTKEPRNPVLSESAGIDFDNNGANAPTVVYDPGMDPPWHMWYAAWSVGNDARTTIGYADSLDGIGWTKRGEVLTFGAPGEFDDEGMVPGPVLHVDGKWLVYYAGLTGLNDSWSSDAVYSMGYAETSASSPGGVYTKRGTLANLTSPQPLGDGRVYEAIHLRTLQRYKGAYLGWGTVFHPTSGESREVSFSALGLSMITFAEPAGPILPLEAGTWDAESAENPSVIAIGVH